MSTDDIRTAFERAAKTVSLRPSRGHATRLSKTRLRQGLACEVEEGHWKVSTDMPTGVGGGASAPTPGVLGRAAFGSCLAVCYALYAAKLGVPITSLEVDVEADYDDGALLGVSDNPAGYFEVRYTVRIESPAPVADVRRVLDEGDAHSPYLDVFRRAQPCRRIEQIVSTSTEPVSTHEV